MIGDVQIGRPKSFERYTDEFLCQHPNLRVQNLQSLRARVAMRDGFVDDAVALAQAQSRRDTLRDTCERLQACHAQRMDAALMARQAWDARRRMERRADTDVVWAVMHACLHHAAAALPREPVLSPLRRPTDIELLARHLGTTHAAGESGKRLAEAQLRLAACEETLGTLREDLASLRQAVQLDLAHGTRPSELPKHSKLRSRLDAVVEAQARLQKALVETSADAEAIEGMMASLPPTARQAYAALMPPPNLLGVAVPRGTRLQMPAYASSVATEVHHPLRRVRATVGDLRGVVNADGDTAGTRASTCAP